MLFFFYGATTLEQPAPRPAARLQSGTEHRARQTALATLRTEPTLATRPAVVSARRPIATHRAR